MMASPWTRQCHKTRSFSGPPHLPKGETLKAKIHKQNRQYYWDRFMTNQVEMNNSMI